MARVNVTQCHDKPLPEVREIVHDVADMLTTNYGLKSRWQGEDCVHFDCSGVVGGVSDGLCDRPGTAKKKILSLNARYPAILDFIFTSDLCVAGFAQYQRADQYGFVEAGYHRCTAPDSVHQYGGLSWHHLQLSAVHDPAALRQPRKTRW